MKAFSGGQLLEAGTSPFGRVLTEYQCVQYVLDKPGVLTVLTEIRGKADLQRILGFCSAKAEEKDYSIIGTFAPEDAEGHCGDYLQKTFSLQPARNRFLSADDSG